MIDEQKKTILKKIPSVDKMVRSITSKNTFARASRRLIVSCVKSSICHFKSLILEGNNPFAQNTPLECILEDVICRIEDMSSPKLRRVINATGVVMHTNLGRSLLAREAIENLTPVLDHYSNLEFNISKGCRGNRYAVVEPLLCEMSGAESAFVVNNNAAAVLICLNTIADSKEVVISRGELVEIGGSFRITDIMCKSGSIIKEVGTTNRTRIKDYTEAITDNTGLLMKVHTSNYAIIGFTESVPLPNLVKLGKHNSLPVMEDIGSGSFINFSKYGFEQEPTVQQSIAHGVDIITFSGDKLLGGPQAGIILGKKNYIDRIRRNPLARVLRVDKMTLSTLEATLRLYFNEEEALRKIPTLNMLFQDISCIEKKAHDLLNKIKTICDNYGRKVAIKIFDMFSLAGGGALPAARFPSKCLGITIEGLSVNSLEKFMRNYSTSIVGRIEDSYYILDPRTISHDDASVIGEAFEKLFSTYF